jgi:hypothetical protein
MVTGGWQKVAVITRHLHCQLRLIVDNSSSQPVTVNNLDIPLWGGAGILSKQVTSLSTTVGVGSPKNACA